MLKQAKMGVLRLAGATGASGLLSGSAWRRHRLLILCYHGVSMYDEHEWADLYISPETLRRRMELVARARCPVIPLSEAADRPRCHAIPLSGAVDRLQKGTLPDRAVALTFDDGLHDFFSVAFPIVEWFGYPVTLYLTTYYVEFNRPVFDPMCSYLLWKGRHKQKLEWPEVFPARRSSDLCAPICCGRGAISKSWNGRRCSLPRLRWAATATNARLRRSGSLRYRASSPAGRKTTCWPGLRGASTSITRNSAGSV